MEKERERRTSVRPAGRKPAYRGAIQRTTVLESNGPQGKVRGTPQQLVERYALGARNAGRAGDVILAEKLQQHAEHYRRILAQIPGGKRSGDYVMGEGSSFGDGESDMGEEADDEACGDRCSFSG